MPRLVLSALLAVVLALSLVAYGGPGSPAAADVRRVAGPGRVETAALVSAQAFDPGARRVYVATGVNFPDALAAGPAAAAFGGPVLLTTGTTPPAATVAELQRLRPQEILVVGGVSAIADQVADELGRLVGVGKRRLAGLDRFTTAAELARDAFLAPVPVAYVATGGGFADALAGGAAAARHSGPLLLVTRGSVPEPTAAALAALRPQRIVVLGGTGVIGEEVVASLQAFTNGPIERLAGPDRFATGVAVSAATFPDGASTVYLATGENFPDALAGGPAAASDGAPLLLTAHARLPEVVAAELERLAPDDIVVLGGAGAVSEEVAGAAGDAAARGRARRGGGTDPPQGPGDGDQMIAFTYEPVAGCEGPCPEQTTIWTARTDGSGGSAATAPGDGFDRYPRWSPDGSMLAFTRVSPATATGEVFVLDMAADGFAAARQVTRSVDAHGGRGCDWIAMTPVWSPDSSRLAVTCTDGTGSGSVVLVAAADGSGHFPVASEPRQADAWPTWSPDSRQLAFARSDLATPFGDPGRVQIWTADVGPQAASNLRPLVSGAGAADHPRWSPGGDEVLFVDLDELTFRPALKVVTVATGQTRLRYMPPADRNVALYDAAWSPDGRRVALPVGNGLTESAVHVLDATGADTALSPVQALAFAPSWSTDGSRVIFDVVTHDGAGVERQRLATAGPDGAGYTTLPLDDAHAYDATWRPTAMR